MRYPLKKRRFVVNLPLPHFNLILGNGKEASSNGDAAPEVAGAAVEGEDTMKNLRKTFAGIFGDLQ